MKEIGELLKNKRLEIGMSVEEISKKTRLSVAHIHALEDGNIKYFDNDLSYLRFYIKAYCNAINMNYDEVKTLIQDSVLEYTTSFQIKKEDSIKQSEENIRSMSKNKVQHKKVNLNGTPSMNKLKQQGKKLDFSLISFLGVISILLVCVVCVAGMYLFNNLNKNEEPSIPNNPVVETPNTDKDPVVDVPVQKDEEEEEPIILEMTVTKTGVDRYVIENATEEIVITAEFIPSSWFKATMDGKEMSKPVAKIYDSGSSLDIVMDPLKNKELDLRFGYFAGMKLKVNGEYIEIDESIANKPNSLNIYFEIGGTNNEFAQ